MPGGHGSRLSITVASGWRAASLDSVDAVLGFDPRTVSLGEFAPSTTVSLRLSAKRRF